MAKHNDLADRPDFILDVKQELDFHDIRDRWIPQGWSKTTIFRAYALVRETNGTNHNNHDLETVEDTNEGENIDMITTLEAPATSSVKKLIEQMTPAPIIDMTNAICIAITLKKPGNRARVNADEIEVDADRDCLTVSKEIWDSECFKRVRSFDVQIRNRMKELCLPSVRFLKGGTYVVSPTLVKRVDGEMQQMFCDRHEMISGFIDEYPTLIEEAKSRLRALFNEADYPTAAKLRRSFSEDIDYFSFSSANSLRKISADIFEREQAKAQARVDQMVADIEASLYAGAKKTVDKLLDTLDGDTEGSKRRVRGDAVERWRNFFELLKERNMTNNGNLAAIADRGLAALDGIDTQALKDSDAVRQTIISKFEDIQTLIDGTTMEAPTRKIRL